MLIETNLTTGNKGQIMVAIGKRYAPFMTCDFDS